MMKVKLIILLFLLCTNGANQLIWGRVAAPDTLLKVLQMNIWQEGTMIEGGFEAIANEIVRTDADVVFLSEVRNYNEKKFIPRLLEALDHRGKTYYGEYSRLDVGILTKWEIKDQRVIYPVDEGHGSILRAEFSTEKHTVAAYAAHLDYKNYACYLPRGYNGASWEKMDSPVSNADSVLTANRLSQRDEAIGIFLNAVRNDIGEGNVILLGGDFNEPSHLDWQDDTKNLWDHNGLVINWDCSVMLLQNGFKDAYRELYPNPVTHPGFTFPSDNKDVAIKKLTWAPGADERDRIDFIYYFADNQISPTDATMVGPSSTIIRSRRTEESCDDRFILPQGVWPSDHKAILITFKLQ